MKTYEEYIANLYQDFDNFIPTKEQYEKMLLISEKRHQDFLLHQKELRIQNEKYDKAEKDAMDVYIFIMAITWVILTVEMLVLMVKKIEFIVL